MTFRSVLVQQDTTPGAAGRLAAAVRIASTSKAVLSGVFLKSGYMSPSGVMSPVAAADALFADQRRQISQQCATVKQVFEAATRDAALDSNWHELNGDFDDDLIAHARMHDLVIVPGHMVSASGDHTISAESVAMACGGPVLVLPESGYPASFGRKIVLAWKDCREAARALRDAWPFLRQAEEIHVVTVAREGVRQVDDLLQQQLQIHGCSSARLTLDRDSDRPAGELIRRHVDLLGADMIVLGLFGHSRLQETALGGVSKYLLANSPMPLLVSH